MTDDEPDDDRPDWTGIAAEYQEAEARFEYWQEVREWWRETAMVDDGTLAREALKLRLRVG